MRVESARMAAKPPTPIGVIAASEPPAIITSASSRRMISKASPIACADAVQAVQISADGSAYAPHETEASALASALLGRTPVAVTCQFPKPTMVAPVAKIAVRMHAELPINMPTTTALSITVPGARWQTVGWLLSYADRYGIDSVAYDGHTWTRAHGWKNSSASATAVVATLAKL